MPTSAAKLTSTIQNGQCQGIGTIATNTNQGGGQSQLCCPLIQGTWHTVPSHDHVIDANMQDAPIIMATHHRLHMMVDDWARAILVLS